MNDLLTLNQHDSVLQRPQSMAQIGYIHYSWHLLTWIIAAVVEVFFSVGTLTCNINLQLYSFNRDSAVAYGTFSFDQIIPDIWSESFWDCVHVFRHLEPQHPLYELSIAPRKLHESPAPGYKHVTLFYNEKKDNSNKLILLRKREKARSEYFKIVDLFSVPLNLRPLNLSLPKSEYRTSSAWFGVEFILIY